MLVEQDPELFMKPHFYRVVRIFSYVLPFLHLVVLHFVAPVIFVVALFYFLTYPHTEPWIDPAFRRASHWCSNPTFKRIRPIELRHSDKFSDDITLECVEEYRSDVRANIRELATVRNYFWIADAVGLALSLLLVYPRSIALLCRHRPYIILGFLLVTLLMAALNNNLAYLGLYTATLYRFYLVSQEAREKHTKFTVDYRWETFSLRHAIWLLGTTSKTNQEQAVSPLLGCRTTLTYAPSNYMLIMLLDPHRRTTVSSFDTGGTRVPYEQGLLKLRTVLLLYTKFVAVQIRGLINSRPPGNRSLIPNLEFTVQAPDRVTVLFRRGLIFLLLNSVILLSLLASIL